MSFDSHLSVATIQELEASLKQMKKDIQAGATDGPAEFKEQAEFLLAIIANLEGEIEGVESLDNLEINKKVRVIALMNLFYDCIDSVLGDEGEEFDDEDDYDEDEEEFEEDKK